MNLNFHIDEVRSVNVRGSNYPVTIAGKGVPCLVVGNGIIVQRTLSQHFKEEFEVYATDLYWERAYGLQDPTSLTFNQILEDIVELCTALELEKPIIFGFSAYGIVAIELVKRYPDLARGVIIAGTPLNSNAEVGINNQKIFNTTADSQRKKIDADRRMLVSKEDLSNLSTHERFKREYIYRDAPRYWYNPEFDCTHLWEGIELDPVFDHFFISVIPPVDVLKGLKKIQIPVYLAAGLHDYDCCPAQGWGGVKNLPPKFKMEVFSKSGHYPQYEEQALFDTRLINWIKLL